MKYRMDDDGVIVDTDRATGEWEEASRWNGKFNISVATGGQWSHQRLYLSAKRRYYLLSWSDWQGTRGSTRWMSPKEAAAWLALNGHVMPADLTAVAAEVTE